jgi:hypothetical protein
MPAPLPVPPPGFPFHQNAHNLTIAPGSPTVRPPLASGPTTTTGNPPASPPPPGPAATGGVTTFLGGPTAHPPPPGHAVAGGLAAASRTARGTVLAVRPPPRAVRPRDPSWLLHHVLRQPPSCPARHPHLQLRTTWRPWLHRHLTWPRCP